MAHMSLPPINVRTLITWSLAVGLICALPLLAQLESKLPPEVDRQLESTPVMFIANKGQLETGTDFLAMSRHLKAQLASDRIVLTEGSDKVEMMFPGSRQAPEIEGLHRLDTRVTFLRADGRGEGLAIPAFASVVYRDLYSGIDLVVGSTNGLLKTEFVVQAGIDHRAIRVRYRGATRIKVEDNGALTIYAANGIFREEAPVVYQDIAGRRSYVKARYLLVGDETVGFLIDDYDHQRSLVVDPVISYSTYFGGAQPDTGASVAIDAAGAIYVAGYTESSTLSIPNPIYPQRGGADAFIFKFNSAGTQIVFATFIGGAGDDRAYSVAVDASGAAYACGSTTSSNFPTKNAAPIQATRGGLRDGFVLKLNAIGDSLIYSSYIGGSGDDVLYSCVIDAYGQLYGVGETDSLNLPVKSPFQSTNAGKTDAFLVKINLNSALAFSTYLGGSDDDGGRGIAIHPTQLTPYVTGFTSSSNFPVRNPAQSALLGGRDAFVVRFNSDANQLVFSTYLGGSNGSVIHPEQGTAIAVDTYGNNYVTGVTTSSDFPIVNAFQGTNRGGLDAFFAKHDNGGVRVYSSYLGGAGTDMGTSISVDSNRRIYVTGYTSSTNFPTVLPIQSQNAGGYDAFITHVDVNGNSAAFSSYLGGAGSDIANGITVTRSGDMVLVGATSSTNFPTRLPYQNSQGGTLDMFVSKLSAAPLPPTAPVYVSLFPNSGSGGTTNFSLSYTDANGAGNVDSIQVLVNAVFRGAGSCQIAYVHTTGLLYLLSDTGGAWMGGYAPGVLNTLSNSQCTLDVGSATVSASGNDITVTLPISFATTTLVGRQNIYAIALDRDGLRSDWNIRGYWLLP